MKRKFDLLRTYPYYQPPKEGNRILVILENPTWKEMCLGRPAVCETGDNLNILLWILNSIKANEFGDLAGQFVKNDICILNALNQCGKYDNVPIEIIEKAGLTNLGVLKSVVESFDFVLVFGKIAENVCASVLKDAGKKTLYLHHLSPLAVNQFNKLSAMKTWFEDRLSLKDYDTSYLRLSVFARYIVDNFNQPERAESFAVYAKQYKYKK